MPNSWRNIFIPEYECTHNPFVIVDLLVDRWMTWVEGCVDLHTGNYVYKVTTSMLFFFLTRKYMYVLDKTYLDFLNIRGLDSHGYF